MDPLEMARKRHTLALEAFEFIALAANDERKVTHAKHVNSNYSQALNCLQSEIDSASNMVRRVEAIGR